MWFMAQLADNLTSELVPLLASAHPRTRLGRFGLSLAHEIRRVRSRLRRNEGRVQTAHNYAEAEHGLLSEAGPRPVQPLDARSRKTELEQVSVNCEDCRPVGVSVVVNNYNYAQYLREAIESVLAQTYHHVELVVVDDGSTDESREILQDYRSCAVLILKENGGQASAFNAGIAQASGDLILLLDSDDYLLPHAVEECVRRFPRGYSRVFYRMQVVDSDSQPVSNPKLAVPFMNMDGNVLLALEKGAGFPAVPTSGNMFDASKLKSILPIPEEEYRICADAYLFIRTTLTGDVLSIDKELAAYRVHGANNFAPQVAGTLTDVRRLARQLENHVKCTALIFEACAEAGISTSAYTRTLARQFFPVQYRCAAFALRLQSPHAPNLNRLTLSLEILKYVQAGVGRLGKRLLKGGYLLVLVWLPRRFSRYLLEVITSFLASRTGRHRALAVSSDLSARLSQKHVRLG